MSSAKETILRAVELLESENEGLKQINNKIVEEMGALRRENELLRQELSLSKTDQQELRNQLCILEDDNSQLQKEYQLQTVNYEAEHTTNKELSSKLKDTQIKFNKHIEDLNNEIIQRDALQKKLEREIEALRLKLDRAGRKNYSDRDIELLHEVEMLKNEKRDTETEKDETERENRKLRQELKNLRISLDEKDGELRNENRRHSLLTKEFNSLLDENNRLKLQMRRKGANPQSLQSKSSENVLEESILTVPQMTKKSKSGVSREPSLIINNEVFQPTKDYPAASREKPNTRRSIGGPSSPMREPTTVKRTGNFGSVSSLKDLGRKSLKHPASKPAEDSSSNQDSLPSLTRTSSSHGNTRSYEKAWNV